MGQCRANRVYHLTEQSLYLVLWRHLFIISDLLLISSLGSPLRISNFSLKHISHLRDPHWYGNDCLWRVHFISYGVFWVWRFQMYFERHVSLFRRGLENDDLWFANLFLNIGSVEPKYCLISDRAVTSARYTIAPFVHSPLRGQCSFRAAGQLQWFSFSTVAGARIFLLCFAIIDFMFGVQL